MSNYDPIKITLTKEAALAKLEELTGIDTAGWSVMKDGLRFETMEHGSVAVHLDLFTIVSATVLAEIIQAAAFLPELKSHDSQSEVQS